MDSNTLPPNDKQDPIQTSSGETSPTTGQGTTSTPAKPAAAPARPPRQSAADFLATQDFTSISDAVNEAVKGLSELELTAGAGGSSSTPEPTTGVLISGRIANIGSEDVLIDMGSKDLGVMPRSDLEATKTYQVGDSIQIVVTGDDPKGGLKTVSHKAARQELLLRDMEIGRVVEGPVTGMNKGGLEVLVEGLRAFIPASQVDLHFLKDISSLIGQKVRAEVTKFDRADKNLVLSRRKVLMRESDSTKEQIFDTLQVGETRRGKVKGLAEYGAFVDIGGVDGLLHISDMSWGRIDKPDEVVKEGDEIEVKIIKINKEKKKISLSLKQTIQDPWVGAGEKYPVGTKLQGRVVRLQNFGAFVELEPGVDGLLPISEMSWTKRLRHPSDMVKEGDIVEASVISCEPDKKRVSLSIKALANDPWAMVTQNYPVGAKVKGTVVRTTDFGAFVKLEEGIEGLMHISELSDKRVKAVTDVVKPGSEVEVRILSVDTDGKKVSLSMKPPPVEPSPEEIAKARAEREAVEKRRNKPRRGGITFSWDQGLAGLDPSKFAR